MSDRFCILLDDIRRSSEMQVIKDWQEQLNAEILMSKVYGLLYKGERFSSMPLSH